MIRRTFLVLVLSAVSALGQTRTLTAEDYARAEKFLSYNANPLVLHGNVRPTWLPDDRFWYRVTTEKGNEFILVDPARGTRSAAFDHVRLAEALSAASAAKYEPFRLPFNSLNFEDKGGSITFNAANRRWKCDTTGSRCE